MTALEADHDGPRDGDRRSRRRAERRTQVFEAAIELFVEKGFDNTTMGDIAERADVARASVFNYYQRKAAFLDEWSALRRQRAARAVEEIDSGRQNLRANVTRYLVELAVISEGARDETLAMSSAILTSYVSSQTALSADLLPYIEQAASRSELRTGVRSDLVARLVATGYFATLSLWIEPGPAPFDLRAEVVDMLDLLFLGLLKQPPT